MACWRLEAVSKFLPPLSDLRPLKHARSGSTARNTGPTLSRMQRTIVDTRSARSQACALQKHGARYRVHTVSRQGRNCLRPAGAMTQVRLEEEPWLYRRS